MADHVKQTKNKIWELKRSIQQEEAQRDGWASTLPEMETGIAVSEPGEQQDVWKAMKAEADSAIATLDASIARSQEQLAALEAELPHAPEPALPKFDPEKHPLLRKAIEKQEPEKAVVFSTGDMCEAQWTDKSWYKAKIQSILGSVSAPKYLVRFIEYDETMTVDRSAVRPLPSKRKRETEPAGAPQPAASVTSTPHVISGPASMNANAQTAKNTTANEDAGPVKASRVPNKGVLKKRATNWQDFQAKAGKKMPKKESMFRTSTEFGSRVGFTGSGKGMTETHKRKRYDHKADADNDDEYNESTPQKSKRF